jgi:hypothetical protein
MENDSPELNREAILRLIRDLPEAASTAPSRQAIQDAKELRRTIRRFKREGHQLDCHGVCVDPLANAVLWNSPEGAKYGRMVKRALIRPNSTIVKAHLETGLPIESISTFEQLFFNVLARKTDTDYMIHVANMEGLMQEMLGKDYNNGKHSEQDSKLPVQVEEEGLGKQ